MDRGHVGEVGWGGGHVGVFWLRMVDGLHVQSGKKAVEGGDVAEIG